MSVNHSIIPFEDRLRHDDVLKWLGFPIPDNVKTGRFPTPNELRSVMDQLHGYSVKYQVGSYYWIADISNEFPVLVAEAIAFMDNPDQPQKFRFSGDREMLTHILKQLPEECGTFLIMTEGEHPEFIMSEGATL